MGVSLPSLSLLALPSRLSLKRETDVWIGACRLSEKMTPAAITASFNLPLYDAEYARLQAELQEVRLSPLLEISRVETDLAWATSSLRSLTRRS